MSHDTEKKISALKDIAIGRCRERLELAARKANSPSGITFHDQLGFTSILKRNRGL
jgi:hypothetical protein